MKIKEIQEHIHAMHYSPNNVIGLKLTMLAIISALSVAPNLFAEYKEEVYSIRRLYDRCKDDCKDDEFKAIKVLLDDILDTIDPEIIIPVLTTESFGMT
jgi:hypothetical protein